MTIIKKTDNDQSGCVFGVLEPSCTAGGYVKCCGLCGKQFDSLSKNETWLTYDPAILLLDIYSRDLTYVQPKICTHLFKFLDTLDCPLKVKGALEYPSFYRCSLPPSCPLLPPLQVQLPTANEWIWWVNTPLASPFRSRNSEACAIPSPRALREIKPQLSTTVACFFT